MNNELYNFLLTIKEKTGIDIDAFTENQSFHVSTSGNGNIVMPSRNDFAEIYSDTRGGRTFFKFKFRNANFIGSILGCGETEKNYTYFILSLIENTLSKENLIGRNEYIKNILLGDCSRAQVQRFMRKFAVPLCECFVLAISFVSKGKEIQSFLEQLANEYNDSMVVMDEGTFALIRFMKKDSDEKQVEFANYLVNSILEEVGVYVKIGVGGIVSNLSEANVSYSQATSAIKLSESFHTKSYVHTYKEYVMGKMLEEIPKFKLMEYLDVLLGSKAKSIFEDQDMLDTAEEFLDNSLNLSETSRKLFMHRNTLMYRLDKIEKMTGLDIRNFSDAVTFRLITILSKLVGKKA